MLDEMQMLQEEFENKVERDTQPFRIAAGATTLIYRLGEPLRKLQHRYPAMDLHVTVLPTEAIVAGLHEREFDVGLISLPYFDPALRVIPLFEEELLFVRPAIYLSNGEPQGTIQPSELAELSFLLYPSHSNVRKLIDRFFQDLKIKPKVLMDAEDTEVIKAMVEAGFGCSFLPEYALRGSPGFYEVLYPEHRRLVRKQALAISQTSRRRALTEVVAEFLSQALKPAQNTLATPSRKRRKIHKENTQI
ncbi:MAG: LysR family transcriptional regulator substrate-binding protein [Acidobacteriaceae bacterium]